MKHLIRIAIPVMLTAGMAMCQELVPRRWSHLPKGKNFVGVGYAYTRADISFDPVLQIEDAKLDMHTFAISYLRTLELLGTSARVEAKIPIQDGHWSGLLQGQPASAHRTGLADPVLRMAINLLGGPPLEGEEFARYRAATDVETIVGLGLAVHFPLGQYDEDKLLNLGTNRFTFRPQLGVEHQHGKWTAELTGSTWFFTDNYSFFNGYRLEQDPLLTIQAHLTYTFRPGIWATLGGALGFGGEFTIDGVDKEDDQFNTGWGVGLGYSLTRNFGLKFTYIGLYNHSDTGADSNSLMLGASYFW